VAATVKKGKKERTRKHNETGKTQEGRKERMEEIKRKRKKERK
jgi:hypothetical protein